MLMRQQPMTAKDVIFVTIEDEHGQANVVVYTHIAERDRVTLLTAALLRRSAMIRLRCFTS